MTDGQLMTVESCLLGLQFQAVSDCSQLPSLFAEDLAATIV